MEIIFIVALIALAVIWFIRRTYKAGNPDFWRVAASVPDEAYDWFKAEDCWVIVERGSDARPEGSYTGPFRLAIPKLGGKVIIVYGRENMIDDSQRRFMERYAA